MNDPNRRYAAAMIVHGAWFMVNKKQYERALGCHPRRRKDPF
jgi:hypothetical protein